VKWKERGNQSQNPNWNEQKISIGKCNEGPRIAVVTHGGTRTGVDTMNGGKHTDKWVRKSARPMLTFEPNKEKDMYQWQEKRY
jgi:hypothetical protein